MRKREAVETRSTRQGDETEAWQRSIRQGISSSENYRLRGDGGEGQCRDWKGLDDEGEIDSLW